MEVINCTITNKNGKANFEIFKNIRVHEKKCKDVRRNTLNFFNLLVHIGMNPLTRQPVGHGRKGWTSLVVHPPLFLNNNVMLLK